MYCMSALLEFAAFFKLRSQYKHAHEHEHDGLKADKAPRPAAL